jgi:hypothetical protein
MGLLPGHFREPTDKNRAGNPGNREKRGFQAWPDWDRELAGVEFGKNTLKKRKTGRF